MSWGSQTILPMQRSGMKITSVISGTFSNILDYIITFSRYCVPGITQVQLYILDYIKYNMYRQCQIYGCMANGISIMY